jgi:hypothetical protein
MLSGIGYCWSFLVPPKNLVIVACIAGVISGALFSGVQDGYRYNPLYCDGKPLGWILGFVTPNRWFVETTLVNELRTMPAQYGFTYNEKRAAMMPDIAQKIKKYDWINSEGPFNGGRATGWSGIYGYGCLDFENAERHRVHLGAGWYFNMSFLVAYGLVYRLLACFLIVWTDRRKQNKVPLAQTLKACCCGRFGNRKKQTQNGTNGTEMGTMQSVSTANPVAMAEEKNIVAYI